ncbi:MAG: glycosyl transferase [Proteobacteria bacterium]|nr:glycosyl transferase [Pseudomonadota bacterium]
MTGKRVFVYVQHLLGIGHLKRAATLANALAAEGLEVTLASGGFAVPDLELRGVRLVQLPPAGTGDSGFKSLVDANGVPVDEGWKARRRDLLLEAWHACDPQVLLIELYPFGRRQMRFELLPLLESASRARPRPLVVSSVRDVLGGGQKDPARQDEMLEVFRKYFDHLLVHGDPSLIPLERTFRHARRIADRLHYTGYVVERIAPRTIKSEVGSMEGAGEVLVSAGGGAVGRNLLEAAIRARPLSGLSMRTWRILCGVNAGQADMEALSRLAIRTGEGRVVVEQSRHDFASMLERCELSVSQGGYNTMMEILQAGARCVVVPFSGGAEIEQTLRTRLLADRGLVEMVEESALDPQVLAAAVDRAAAKPRGAADGIDLGGAERTASLVRHWASEAAW